YDMYHVYTVDEHTLFAIGILHQIESGQLKAELPVASAIMPTIVSRRALYLAALLHDIAKGRGGDHSQLGEKIALNLGPRRGLTVEARDTRIAAAQAAARAALPDFSDDEFAAFTSRGYPFYWLSLDAETHARHARLMRQADANDAPLTVEKRIDPARAVTEL